MNKKKIKIAFVDFWRHWDSENNFIVNALKKEYDIEISDKPDYIIFSNFNRFFDHIHYKKCVKIFYTQENICPDFNFADYGIGFEMINYGDRYLRYPICFIPERYALVWNAMREKHCRVNVEESIDRNFCSFVVSNERANPLRMKMFRLLSEYKQVNSGGKYMNNIGIPEGVSDKLEFEKNHKFSICFENSRQSGYMTEKIIEAFASGAIPIYWGDPKIGKLFNQNAFIDVGRFSSLEGAIEYIKNVDQDEELYKKMIQTPALLNGYEDEWDKKQLELITFLKNIFDQEKNEAFRRNRDFWGEIYVKWYYEKIREYNFIHNNNILKVIRLAGRNGKKIMKKVIKRA